MSFSKRKLVFITGATSGIGQAAAKIFAKNGYNLIITGRRNERLSEVSQRLVRKYGSEVKTLCFDIRHNDEVNAAWQSLDPNWQVVDILVNNAGTTRDMLLAMMPEGDWDLVIATNLKSAYNCSKAALKPMMRQKYGRVVNITSVAGLSGNGGQTNYSASKAGLIGFTKSLAKEVGGRNITVNAVAPGFIPTDLTNEILGKIQEEAIKATPLGRLGTVEDVAKAVAFLASDDAAFITGQVLSVDGGMVMQ